jgi:hypothetical protein
MGEKKGDHIDKRIHSTDLTHLALVLGLLS